MYNRYRRNGSFFQAFFWVLVGFMLGQVVRLDIQLLPRQTFTTGAIHHANR